MTEVLKRNLQGLIQADKGTGSIESSGTSSTLAVPSMPAPVPYARACLDRIRNERPETLRRLHYFAKDYALGTSTRLRNRHCSTAEAPLPVQPPDACW